MGFCQSQCRAVREIEGDVTTKRKNPSINGCNEALLHSSSDVKIQHYRETIDVGTEKKVSETPQCKRKQLFFCSFCYLFFILSFSTLKQTKGF